MSKHLAVIRAWTSCGAYCDLMASAIVFRERASILRGKPIATSVQVLSCCASTELETEGAVEIVRNCALISAICC
eukprot:7849118-Pyramimonas_sp.AAC.1